MWPFSRVAPVRRGPVEWVRAGVTTSPVALRGIDLALGPWLISCAWFFRERLHADDLKRGLAAALARYPILAGRIERLADGRVQVRCDDSGVEFHEADEPTRFAEPSPEAPAKERAARYTVLSEQLRLADGRTAPTRVQLTHLPGGGSVVGVAISHLILDGDSFFRFVDAWARACRGEALTDAPITDRAVALDPLAQVDDRGETPRMKILSAPSMALYAGRMVVALAGTVASKVVRLSADDIAALKRDAHREGRTCSTNDVVSGYVWRSFLRLRGDRGREERLHLVADARRHGAPPLPREYLGNAACSTYVRGTFSEVTGGSLAFAAGRVRDLVDRFPSEVFAEDVRITERMAREGRLSRAVPTLVSECFDGHVCVDSWARFPMYDADFGAGKPYWVTVPPNPVPFFAFPFPTPDGTGIDVHASLPRDLVGRFTAPSGADRSAL